MAAKRREQRDIKKNTGSLPLRIPPTADVWMCEGLQQSCTISSVLSVFFCLWSWVVVGCVRQCCPEWISDNPLHSATLPHYVRATKRKRGETNTWDALGIERERRGRMRTVTEDVDEIGCILFFHKRFFGFGTERCLGWGLLSGDMIFYS